MLTNQLGYKFLKIFSSLETIRISSNGRYITTDNTKPPPKRIDRSKVPKLIEHDIEEKFISGSGPGGQCVNKSVNCCQLKHKPTGIVVKAHQQRELEKNRQIARELLVERLDNLYNGQDSVTNQKKRLALYRINLRESQQQRIRELKEEYRKGQMNNETKRGTSPE